MPKTLTACLLMVAATSASAATYDPCIEAGNMIREVADARDSGVMMSKFLISKAGKFASDKEQESYFRTAAAIFLDPTSSAEKLETAAIDACTAEF